MTRSWFAAALSIAALSLLIYSFNHMIQSAVSSNAEFEEKLLAGRNYMHAVRSLNSPAKCKANLLDKLPGEWKAEAPLENLEFMGFNAQLRPAEAHPSPTMKRVELVLPDRFGGHTLPLNIQLNEKQIAQACAVDLNGVRFKLGSSVLVTDLCSPVDPTPYYYSRCPEGTVLTKEYRPGALFCCPLEG